MKRCKSMKKNSKRNKGLENNSLRWKLIQRKEKKARTMRKDIRGQGCSRKRGWNFSTNNSSYKSGESSTNGWGRGNPRLSYDKSQVQCYNCQNFGHYASKYRAQSTRVDEKVNYDQEENNKIVHFYYQNLILFLYEKIHLN